MLKRFLKLFMKNCPDCDGSGWYVASEDVDGLIYHVPCFGCRGRGLR